MGWIAIFFFVFAAFAALGSVQHTHAGNPGPAQLGANATWFFAFIGVVCLACM